MKVIERDLPLNLCDPRRFDLPFAGKRGREAHPLDKCLSLIGPVPRAWDLNPCVFQVIAQHAEGVVALRAEE